METTQPLNVSICENCKKLITVPKHCGKSMEMVNGNWICWKGEHPPCCGRPSSIEYEPCCDNPSIPI